MPGRHAAFFALVLVGAACTRTQETETTPPPPMILRGSALDASPPAAQPSSSSAPAVADPSKAKAWTDDAVVAALAADCRWQPPPGTDQEPGGPLLCDLEFEQGCAPDPCRDVDQSECKPACKRGCDQCGAICTSSCEACKRPCTDEACRRACAVACGSCRQSCLQAKDQCATGTCGAALQACRHKRAEDWNKGPCKETCPRVADCYRTCQEKFYDATPDGGSDAVVAAATARKEKCQSACARFMGRCPASNFDQCKVGAWPSRD